MNLNTKSSRGITLIALVVTIVVLLILVGVAISSLVGQNGILAQVGKAKERWEEARKEEENILGMYEDKIEDSIAGGIWIISLNTDELSPDLKINIKSKFYNVIPGSLKEYKELYILKASGKDKEYNSIDEYVCAMMRIQFNG